MLGYKRKYVAGLIDSRGNITIDKWGNSYKVYLKFMSNNLFFLDKVDRAMRELGYSGKLQLGNIINAKQTFILMFNAKLTREILESLNVNLRIKKDVVKSAIKFHDEYKGWNKEKRLTAYNKFRELKRKRKVYACPN